MSSKREAIGGADFQTFLIGESLSNLQSDRWIGEINGRTGSAKDLFFRFSAYLNISDSVIEGNGLSHGPNRKFSDVELDLSGKRLGGKIMILIWAHTKLMRRVPFVCSGHIFPKSNIVEAEQMKGAFTLECFTGCGCGGASGDFFLERKRFNSYQELKILRE